MPRGGARVNSGPPPDPNALRRDRPTDKDGWRILPAEGRQGPAPEWPLPVDTKLAALVEVLRDRLDLLEDQIAAAEATPKGLIAKAGALRQRIAEVEYEMAIGADLELAMWASIWSTPSAIMWDELRWMREVALYVRWQVKGELGDLDSAKEARQWSDRLGLNPPAMMRLRWKVAAPIDAAAAAPRRTVKRAAGSARDRGLSLIDGG